MKSTLLRRVAAHFMMCSADAQMRVLYRWRREDDDVRAVRIEAVINGKTKRVTLYRHIPGAWSPMPL
ncbi:TPA: hypothetical protein ACUNF5_007294 [Burkholderia orbicola]